VTDGTFTHLLNGVAVEEPIGFKDFTEELSRDVRERIIGVKYKATLTFTHKGHAVLEALFDEQGFCASATYEVRQWCGGVELTVIRGSVILSEAKTNETRCEVECAIADDGIGARVVNNKEIPISPAATKTKNSLTLSPVTAIDISVFDPSANTLVFFPDTRRVWDWFDALQHAVAYITDNEATVVSDWYDSLPVYERYCIIDGFELRTHSGSTDRIVWDFKRLFLEMAMKYNLWVGIERATDGSPILRVEPEGYFYSDSGTIQHTDIQDLVRSCDLDRLWAKVDVGSDTAIKDLGGAGFSLPFLALRGFTKEQFHFTGVCNTSETLDLVNEWIIDTNVIENVLEDGNDEYDDDLFLIQYNPDTLQATPSDYLTNDGNAPWLYNYALQNGLVLGRYDLPSPVGANFALLNTSFRAERTATGAPEFYTGPASNSSFAIVQFDNDYTAPNFDPSNSWGNGTAQGNPVSQANSRYTAQAQGYYEFYTTVYWRIVKNVPLDAGGPIPLSFYKSIGPRVQVERYDAANTLIGTPVTLSFTQEYTPGQYVAQGAVALSLNMGDYVQVRYLFAYTGFQQQTFFAGPQPGPFEPSGVTVRLDPTSSIATQFVTGGGFVDGGGQARIILYEYERHVDVGTWVSLTGDPKQQIGISGGPEVMHNTHALSAERNIVTGATTWKVIKRP
jgi:hypothetical protein